MLLNCYATRQTDSCPMPSLPDNYKRNFKEDMKTALDLLFKFKEDLDKLHPECCTQISKLLQEKHF